jgi:undecaprenyl-diphosphatase
VSGFLGSLSSRSLKGDPWRKLSWLVMVATIPGGVIGFLFEDAVETTLRSPYVMGSALILFSVVMAIAERVGPKTRKIESIRIGDAILIGFGQAIALIPGISRSGSTISAGLLVGLNRETAARFSFLLSTPIVLGAVAKKTLDLRHAAVTGDDLLLMAIGVLFAAIAGYLSIKWLLIFLGRAPLYAFVWYRVVVGLVVIALASSQALT